MDNETSFRPAEIPIPAQELLTHEGRISPEGKVLARGIYSELKQTQRWPHLAMEDRREVISGQLSKLTTWKKQTPEQQQLLMRRVDQSVMGRHQYEQRLARVQKNMIENPEQALELIAELDIAPESISNLEQGLRHLDVARLAMIDRQMSEKQARQAEEIKKSLAERTAELVQKITNTVKTGPRLPRIGSVGGVAVGIVAGLALVGAVGNNRFARPVSANEAPSPVPIVRPKEESSDDQDVQPVNFKVSFPETNDSTPGDQPVEDAPVQVNETGTNPDNSGDGEPIVQIGSDIPDHNEESRPFSEAVFGTKEWVKTHIQKARQYVQKELEAHPNTTLSIPGVWENPVNIHLQSYLKAVTDAVNAGETELPAPPYDAVNAWLLEDMPNSEVGPLSPGNNLSVLLSIHNLEHWDYANGRPVDSISLSVENMEIGDRIVIGNLVYVLDKKIQIDPNNDEENDTNKMLAQFVDEDPAQQLPYVLIEACGNSDKRNKSNLGEPREIGRFSLESISPLSE